MAFKLLAFASTLAFASAQSIYTGVYGLGYWNETYAVEANQNPNNTKSVPFQIYTNGSWLDQYPKPASGSFLL
jgi:hypothetical protein